MTRSTPKPDAARAPRVALLSKFFWAWVMQRVQPCYLVMLAMGTIGLAVALMVPMTRGPFALVFVPLVLFSFGIGGMIPLSEFVWVSYFGRRHIGAVRSTGLPVATGIAVSARSSRGCTSIAAATTTTRSSAWRVAI